MAHQLIAMATCDYPNMSAQDARPQLAGVRDSVVKLFTGTLKSYRQELVTLATNPRANALHRQLNKWMASADRNPEDWVVLYYTGHAEVVPPASLYLLTTNHKPSQIPSTAFNLQQLADMLNASGENQRRCRVRNLLVILDTCFSGQGVQELASRLSAVFQRSSGGSFYLLAAALPREEAQAGALAKALIESVEELSKRCVQQELLFFDQIMPAINGRLKTQQAILMTVSSPTEEPRFFPNPSFVPVAADVFANEALRAISDQEFREHWGPRGRGVEFDNQRGSYFSGRTTVLDKLTAFLQNDADMRTRVVVGGPGSGKSAILSKIVDASRKGVSGLRVDLAVHAKGKTLPEMCQRFGQALGVDGQPETIVESLRARAGIARVVVDALDEAAEPTEIATQLLRLLSGLQAVKLLVGTRQELLNKLEGAEVIDIDTSEHAQLGDIKDYAKARLLRTAEPGESTPYTNQETVAERVAEHVAGKAYPNFLVARLIVEDLLTRPRAANPDSPEEMDFPTKVTGAFDAYLARFGSNEIRVKDVLRPLAFAEGKGLPWDTIWAPLASAIAAREYTDDDVRWVLEHAGSFILESKESGRAVYRLYHQALADMLIASPYTETADASFVTVLSQYAPRRLRDGGPDWQLASHYARLHLAAHAARAGWQTLERLVEDFEYLVWADPYSLIRVLNVVQSEHGILFAMAYRMCAGRFANNLQVNAALLQIALFSLGAHEVAQSLYAFGQVAWTRLPFFAPHLLCWGHSEGVTSVALGKVDGSPVIVSGSRDHTVRMWDARTGAPHGEPLKGHSDWVNAVALGKVDGSPVIVSGSRDYTVRMWDARTGAPYGEPLKGHSDWVNAVALGEVDGSPVIVSGSEDRTVRMWDARTGAPRGKPLRGHSHIVHAVALGEVDGFPMIVSGSKDCMIVSGSEDRTVRMWDARTGAPRCKPQQWHSSLVEAVALGEVDGFPVIVSGGETVRMWDARTGAPRGKPLQGHSDIVSAVVLGKVDGSPVIVSGSRDCTVRMWDARTGAPRGEPLQGHSHIVHAVALGEVDGSPMIVSGSEDRTVRMWDARTGAPHGEPLQGHSRNVEAVALGEVDGSPVIVSGSWDHTVRMWDARTGAPRGEPLQGHSSLVEAVALGEVDGFPVIVSGGETVRMWDARTGAPRGEPLQHSFFVEAVALGEVDGSPVIVSGSAHTVRMWDARTGAPRGEPLQGHSSLVEAVVLGEVDGSPVIVSGSADKTVRMWDARTGAPRGEPLKGHSDWVNAVALGEVDGSPVIVSGSWDHTVRMWDARTGAPRGEPLQGHSDIVSAVVLGKVGSSPVIISSSDDHTVRIWNRRTFRSLTLPMLANPRALALGRNGSLFIGLTDGGLLSINLKALLATN